MQQARQPLTILLDLEAPVGPEPLIKLAKRVGEERQRVLRFSVFDQRLGQARFDVEAGDTRRSIR